MKKLLIVMLLALFILHTGCSMQTNVPEGNKDKKVGYVLKVDSKNDEIVIDISEWETRNISDTVRTVEGYSYLAKIKDATIICYEDGTEASVTDIRNGQKISLSSIKLDRFLGDAEEIILLEMTHAEKYAALLSPLDDKLNIVVIYEDDFSPDIELAVFKNITKDTVGRWIEYDENYVIDYKQEFDIEQFPVALVFNSEELLFKTYDVQDLDEFLNSHGT